MSRWGGIRGIIVMFIFEGVLGFGCGDGFDGAGRMGGGNPGGVLGGTWSTTNLFMTLLPCCLVHGQFAYFAPEFWSDRISPFRELGNDFVFSL